LHCFLQEFQQEEGDGAHRCGQNKQLRITCALPRLCTIAMLPPPARSGPVCHGYGFLALECFRVPSFEVRARGGLTASWWEQQNIQVEYEWLPL
jgi:hypothetical protein